MLAYFIDFESQSHCDLRKYGIVNYTQHPTTNVYCMAYCKLGTTDKKLWRQGQPLPDFLIRPNLTIIAHNVEFELSILKHVFKIEIPIERAIDTAAIARHHSLPGKLELVGEFLGYPKDMDGHRVMMKLARPRKSGEYFPDEGKWYEDYRKAEAYCLQDLDPCMEIYRRFGPLPKKERIFFELTYRLNQRGLKIDLEGIRLAKELIELERKHYEKKIVGVTSTTENPEGITSGKVVKLAEFCGMPSLAADAIRDELKNYSTPKDRTSKKYHALMCRKILAARSTSKLDSMERFACADGRVHGGLIYSGAERTGRVSGFGIQPHNFPRGAGEATIELFLQMAAGTLPKPYHDTLRDMLRGFILGPLLSADFSQIEARMCAWLAGEEQLLKQFADPNIDPYKEMAAVIYNCDVSEVDKDKRFLGKQAILSAQYGCGPNGFDYMLTSTYDVRLDPNLIELTISKYRRQNRKIVKFWYNVDRAFRSAIQGREVKLGRLEFRNPNKDEVTIKLPSGRLMYYYGASIHGRDVYVYARKKGQSNKWGYTKTYGGKLVENITQAASRDVMYEAKYRVDKAGFHPNLSVHDEVVSEDEPERLPEYERIMKQVPVWAKGLPIDVECFAAERYRK